MLALSGSRPATTGTAAANPIVNTAQTSKFGRWTPPHTLRMTAIAINTAMLSKNVPVTTLTRQVPATIASVLSQSAS